MHRREPRVRNPERTSTAHTFVFGTPPNRRLEMNRSRADTSCTQNGSSICSKQQLSNIATSAASEMRKLSYDNSVALPSVRAAASAALPCHISPILLHGKKRQLSTVGAEMSSSADKNIEAALPGEHFVPPPSACKVKQLRQPLKLESSAVCSSEKTTTRVKPSSAVDGPFTQKQHTTTASSPHRVTRLLSAPLDDGITACRAWHLPPLQGFDDKPHACTKCGSRFRKVRDLNRHVLIHSTARPFVCDVCSRSFRTAASLKGHTLVHTGARPHSCGLCGRQFALSRNLRLHMLIHTGEKPHACCHCGRRFALAGTLKFHLLTHTGEKPFVCGQCGHSFTQSSTLKRHLLTHQ